VSLVGVGGIIAEVVSNPVMAVAVELVQVLARIMVVPVVI
jgi:hypothetical protein